MKISHKSLDISAPIINLFIYKIFTQIPMSIIKSSGSAAPLYTLAGGAASVFIIVLIAACFSKYQKGNILDCVQSSFGTLGKIIVSFVFICYIILSQIFTLSEFSQLARLIAFPTSPLWFVAGFLILGAVLGASGSTSSILRIYGVFVPVIIVVFVLLIGSTILPFGHTSPVACLPVQTGLTFNGFLSQFMLYADIVLLFLIAPAKESRPVFAKQIARGGILSLILLTLFHLAFALRIPDSITQSGQFPVYLLMKEVYFGRFFQRLDALLLLVCCISSMLYMSLALKLSGQVLSQGFCLPEWRIIPVLTGLLSYIAVVFGLMFLKESLENLVYVLSLGVLAILIITAIFVKIRGVLNEKH